VTPYIFLINLHTKDGANRPRIGPKRAFALFQDGFVITHLNHFRYLRCCVNAYGVMISLNLSEILRSYDFAILAGKCFFPLILNVYEICLPKIIS